MSVVDANNEDVNYVDDHNVEDNNVEDNKAEDNNIEDNNGDDINEFKLDYNSFELLAIYTPEPVIIMNDYSDAELIIISDVLKRNKELEKMNKYKSKKMISFSKKLSSEYICYDRNKCSFCSIAFIPFLNPNYFCGRCIKRICFICSFSTKRQENEGTVCPKCYMNLICDNRSGNWLNILSKENDRQRITASAYIASTLVNSHFKQTINENEEWNSIDEIQYKLQADKEDEVLQKQREQAMRRDTLTDSVCSENVDYKASIDVSINYNRKTMDLEIFLNKCYNLPEVDHKLPYSFIKIHIEPFRLKFHPKSRVVCSNSNPTYKEQFKIKLSETKMKSGNLIVTVWCKRKMKKNKFIGEIIIPIFNTINVANGELRNYPLKIGENKSLTENSSSAEKFGLKTMFNTLTESVLDIYDSDHRGVFTPNSDMFKNDPYIYFTIECELSPFGNTYNFKINLLSMFHFENILKDCEQIRIVMYIITIDNSEVLDTQMIELNVDVADDIKMNEEICFNGIQSDVDFGNINIKMEIFTEVENLKADSDSDVSHLLKSLSQDMQNTIPVSIKMKET